MEFIRCGQLGWTDSYDPRYAIAYLDVGSIDDVHPSSLKSCTFNHGFSTAVGVFGTDGLVIEDNVIYHTVGAGE